MQLSSDTKKTSYNVQWVMVVHQHSNTNWTNRYDAN